MTAQRSAERTGVGAVGERGGRRRDGRRGRRERRAKKKRTKKRDQTMAEGWGAGGGGGVERRQTKHGLKNEKETERKATDDTARERAGVRTVVGVRGRG